MPVALMGYSQFCANAYCRMVYNSWLDALCSILSVVAAESLELLVTHPTTAQPVHVKIPEPQRFRTLREQQHKRWNKLAAAALAAKEASDG